MKTLIQHQTPSILFPLMISMLACVSFTIAQPSTSSVFLREGVVIDETRKEMYYTTQTKKVEAISLKTGKTIWATTENFMPLTISNGTLICFGSIQGGQNELSIVGLDITQRGKITTRHSSLLPSQVNINFIRSPYSAFTIRANNFEGEVYINWNYKSKPKRGVLKQDTSGIETNNVMAYSGILKIDKNSGQLINVDTSQLSKVFPKKSIQPMPESRISNIITEQFLSKDDRFILSSYKTADDIIFNNYQWNIYKKETAEKIGNLKDYRSYAPFFIEGNIIYYEVGPYVQLVDKKSRKVPLQIIAVNIINGRKVWSKTILDTIYRGPTPP